MANEPIQGGPYPEPIDPPDGPGQMSAIVGWAAGRSVMRFASIAARDAALPAPVDGMVCFVAADSGYYVRVDGEWRVLWQDTGWVAITVAGGFTAGVGAAAPQVRRIGREVKFMGSITGPLTTTTTTIGTVPAGFRPTDATNATAATAHGNGTVGWGQVNASGEIRVRLATGSATTGTLLFTLSGYMLD